MTVRDQLLYPNWVWILGVLLLILAGAVVVLALKLAKPHRGVGKVQVHSLGQAQKKRYAIQLDEIVQRRQSGGLTDPEAYLALAALVRSAASERTYRDLESITAAEAALYLGHWPIFSQALTYYEQRVFVQSGVSQPSETVLSRQQGQKDEHFSEAIALAQGVCGR